VTVHLATRKWYISDQEWTCNISVFSLHHYVCIIIIIKVHACCTVISRSHDYLLSLSDLSECCFWFILVVSYILSHLRDLQLKDELPSPHLQGCCSYVTLNLIYIVQKCCMRLTFKMSSCLILFVFQNLLL